MSDIRGANAISDAEFLTAFNNLALSNQQLVDELRCGGWTPISVKLRSERLVLCLTVVRVGATKGTVRAIEPYLLTAEAKAWLADGTIPAAPGKGAKAAAAPSAPASGAAPDEDARDLEGDDADDAPTAPGAAPAQPAAQPATRASVPAAGGATKEGGDFRFSCRVFDASYTFTGADKKSAQNAMLAKLRDLNFSKGALYQAGGRNVIGINDIVSGGSYEFKKQLTAA